MRLKKLPWDLTICRLSSAESVDLSADFFFLCKTDEEISLVCSKRSRSIASLSLSLLWSASWASYGVIASPPSLLPAVLGFCAAFSAGSGSAAATVPSSCTLLFNSRSLRSSPAVTAFACALLLIWRSVTRVSMMLFPAPLPMP